MAKMKNNITIKKLGENEFDITIPRQKRDAHLRLEDGKWTLDIFDSTVKTPKKAHIESHTLSSPNWQVSWGEVFRHLQPFIN